MKCNLEIEINFKNSWKPQIDTPFSHQNSSTTISLGGHELRWTSDWGPASLVLLILSSASPIPDTSRVDLSWTWDLDTKIDTFEPEKLHPLGHLTLFVVFDFTKLLNTRGIKVMHHPKPICVQIYIQTIASRKPGAPFGVLRLRHAYWWSVPAMGRAATLDHVTSHVCFSKILVTCAISIYMV